MGNSPIFSVGDRVKLSQEAIDNENYDVDDDTIFIVVSVSTRYMSAMEFFNNDKPDGYHPGYDSSMDGMGLYDLMIEGGGDFGCSLYDWELEHE